MSKHVFKAPNHSAQFDDGFRPAEARADGRGAQFDKFTRSPQNPHGPHSDQGYRPAGASGGDGEEFERALRKVPSQIRSLDAGCPSCGHHHSLEDALRAGRATGKRRDDELDVRKTVRESDEALIRDGAGNPDELHEALVASIAKTYGIASTPSVAKSKSGGRGRGGRASNSFDEALERVRRMPGLKT